VQDGWYVLEAPDGARRFVGPGSPTRRSYGTVVQACLVGAVVEAATRHSPEPTFAGSALDALWRALLTAERHVDPGRRVPSPAARGVQVRELTRWNDHRGRTQDEVLRLLDITISQVMADRGIERSPQTADEATVGALATP
jgi:hypothetical protein